MEATIKPFLLSEDNLCLSTVAYFNYLYSEKLLDKCIKMLQNLEFCADYCEYISNITEDSLKGKATWLDLLVFDGQFHFRYILEWYNHKAANFFGFKFVGHWGSQPIAYQNSFFDCAWRVPHPNLLPRIDSPHINGNAYMIDPKAGKPLHYYLNEWAKCLLNGSLPEF